MIENENLNYIGNHNHTDKGSNLRMLDCICKVIPLIDRAIELGYKGLCITDHSSISSHIKAIQYVKELKEKGIDFKLGLGTEEYVIDNHIDIKENYIGGGVTKFWHMIFIAKNAKGYEQLRKIDSMAWNNSFMTGKMRRTPIDKKQIEDIIEDSKGNLLCSTACLGSELAQHVLAFLKNNDKESKNKCTKLIEWLISTFGKENVALEIQPSFQEEQIIYNKFLMKLSEFYNLKLIITNDTHYLKKEDREVHKAFLTSRDSEERELGDFYANTYLMSIEEMWNYVKDYMDRDYFNQVIENSYNFTKDVEFIDMEHTTIIPERDLTKEKFEVKHIFKDWYGRCDGINKFAHSDFLQDKYLLYMVEQGFLEKKQEFNEENITRIDWEMEELWKVSEILNDRMSAYYNLVDYIVDLCWTIGFVGVSRGCFTKEALVTTLNGMKTLDKVQIGDKVLSANGKFNTVLNTMNYAINEPLIEINYYRQGSSRNVCTLDHKILIRRNEKIYYEQAKNLTTSDYVVRPKVSIGDGSNKEIENINLQDQYIFNYNFDEKYSYKGNNLIKEDDDYWFSLIQKIRLIEKRKDTVYDLTVENDPSYTINNMCVHNSVTGYYTMYLIDIHQMNPIKWNLPAYRHLNSSRVSFPDVDLDTSAKNRPKIIQKLRDTFGADNILNICTFKTETSKSAIKTACRGLGVTSDEADYLASLVVVDRGKQWTISDCLNGNEEKDRKPNREFVSELNRLENSYKVDLKYTIQTIEGLVSGLSIHASGIYIFKNGYIKQNSKMKTLRDDEVTAWEMEDSDYTGGLKYDSLTTECQDKLEVCLLNYLSKYGKVALQPTIRETYNKYIHPDVINYDNTEMWNECSNGQIIDLFQFITPVKCERDLVVILRQVKAL